jgi:preprotein translocase subunit SecD
VSARKSSTRGLWLSIAFVLALTFASVLGFATGALKPLLGLDLEGGVSVILSAPEGTPQSVMEQALGNIRNRVDAFGVGEPEIVLSGSTIEVQIPGAGEGSIEQRPKTQYCLIEPEGDVYGCSDDQATAGRALDQLEVRPQVAEACVVTAEGDRVKCFGSSEEATASLSGASVQPEAGATPTPTSTPTASPTAVGPGTEADRFCVTFPDGSQTACAEDRAEAQTSLDGMKVQTTDRTFCVVQAAPETEATPTPTPSGSATPTASPSPSPSPEPGFESLRSEGATSLPCGLKERAVAQEALDAIEVSRETTQFCVISSAGENLGCFVTRPEAERQLQATSQERLLNVIGETARLEQRVVLQIVTQGDPAYEQLQVTCPTPTDRETKECSFEALQDQEVVYEDAQGGVKYRLGPLVISGADISKAGAALTGGNQQQLSSQWIVTFQLTGDGSDAFGEATTIAVNAPPPQNQIAIVVDREVISAPRVTGAITGGSGQIEGGFGEQEAKDLATQLNAGALPVELTRESVQTVSPTLGKESLQQGIIAGIGGLLLLMLYMLFYYRLLGIVAWVGMSIWAILAVTLIAIAGQQVGYALSLAGVAGLVISLGVTADSYIVFFERLKDEVRGGRSPRTAVQPAFKRSFRTIVAADVVTGIAAAVLYITAVSSVRGFALTLGVATLLDLFVVYFFKRPTVFLIARNDRLVNLRGFGLTSATAADMEDTVPAGGEG